MLPPVLRAVALLLCLSSLCLLLARGCGAQAPLLALSFIASEQGVRDVFLLDARTGILSNLTNTPYSEWGFDWSPDGSRLLYNVSLPNVIGDRVLWQERVAGQPQLLQGIDSLLAFDLGWTPDSRAVSYVSSQPRNISDIYRVFLADGRRENLTNTTQRSEEHPAWSPDGSRLVYLSQGDLYLLHLAAGRHQRLTSSPLRDEAPVWSPDASVLAFYRVTGDGTRRAYLLHLDTVQEQPLNLPAPPGNHPPSWSPDSRSLVLGLATGDILRYNLPTQSTQLLYRSAARSYAPQWSPDGSRIAWLQERSIRLLHLDSGRVQHFAAALEVVAPLRWLAHD